MEWIKALRGSVVCLDTAPLIYLIEESPIYLAVLKAFFESVDRGEITVVTSVLTLTEVLVLPLRQKNPGLAQEYRRILLNAWPHYCDTGVRGDCGRSRARAGET